MQPVFLDRYRTIIERHGAAATRHPDTLIDSDGRYEVFYTPFEHVNGEARLAIVGITPGTTQVGFAYAKVQSLLRAGKSDPEILKEAKREASFGGDQMRPNLLRMLEAHGFPDILGIAQAADLWGSRADLLHATSVVPHAAFVGAKHFAGSFADVMRSQALRSGFERDLIPSLKSMRDDILFVALGPTPLDALDWCARQGLIRSEQVVGAFAHLSSQSGSQVSVMRVAPVGLFAPVVGDDAAVFEMGAATAAFTHGHPSGFLASGHLAVVIAALCRGCGLDEAIDAADAQLAGRDGSAEVARAVAAARALAGRGLPSPEALETLGGGWVAEQAPSIALCCALAADGFGDAVLMAANHSGDSDSTAAIAGNVLGARDGIGAIPAALLDGLEMRAEIERLARDLARAIGDEELPFDDYPPA